MDQRVLDAPESPRHPPAAAAPPLAAVPARTAAWPLDVALVGGLVLLAFLIRWPDFLYIPIFTDESWDAIRSVLVAQGKLQTPVNSSSYISSLQNYLTAALFLGFGWQIGLPRVLALLVGTLTIASAYLLGRAWGGRWVGLLAAALLAANPVHVLVNSHIAWSNSLTPLFSTLALWQLDRAVRSRVGSALAWAAALLALAMLTHPATLVLLPGCAAYLLWKAPGLLRTRWPWLGAALFGLLYSPLLAYNLVTAFDPSGAERASQTHSQGRQSESTAFEEIDSLRFAEAVRKQHAEGRPLGPDLYLDNLDGYALLLVRSAGGAVEQRERLLDFWLDPVLLGWAALGAASLLAAARRGNPLPLLVVASTLAVAPLWSLNRFEPVSNGRYVMPALVALYAAAAALLAALGARLARAPRRTRPLLFIGYALALTFLLVQPLVELVRYFDARPADNRALIEALETIEAERRPGEVVLLDLKLNERRLGEGAVQLDRALEMLLVVRQVPYERAEVEPADLQARLARQPSVLAVVDRANLARLGSRFSLTSLVAITPRVGRGDRLRDPVPSWRDLPPAALLRRLDPQAPPDRKDQKPCPDCGDPAVVRLSPR